LTAGDDITLGGANDFNGAVNAAGNDIALNDVNALTLGAVNAAGDLTIDSNGALNLGTSTVSGNMVANSDNGNIEQTGALSVVGTTGLSAGTGSITLNEVNNSFGGPVTTVGKTVSILGTNAPQSTTSSIDVNLVTDSLLSNVASAMQFKSVSLPNPISSPPLVLGGSTSSISSGGSAASGETIAASGTTNSSGVTVDVKGSQQQDVSTMVAVSLPKGASTIGTGFSFVLPESVGATAGEGVSVQATRVDGSSLPAWLKFDRANLRFEATAVPDGAFPMQLALTIGDQRVVLVISERTE
jgi:hypothetical protein